MLDPPRNRRSARVVGDVRRDEFEDRPLGARPEMNLRCRVETISRKRWACASRVRVISLLPLRLKGVRTRPRSSRQSPTKASR